MVPSFLLIYCLFFFILNVIDNVVKESVEIPDAQIFLSEFLSKNSVRMLHRYAFDVGEFVLDSFP